MAKSHDRTLGKPDPNEDKDLNVEQYKERAQGTIGKAPDPKVSNARPPHKPATH
ncbi:MULTISPECIES: hypothetical protein [Azorhizobium]|uniref:hypothetical protein n=1 Tax=Azorhizobium TaxID=6 RepID=UPI0010F3571F|nr:MULTISPECIES: hypothetical protein [Azorhizobium]TDT88026.1 hypothetical protein DFO45_4813 [Azorhizobium sp. AG788]